MELILFEKIKFKVVINSCDVSIYFIVYIFFERVIK